MTNTESVFHNTILYYNSLRCRFDSQTQRELIFLYLPILVDVTVAQQNGSQLVKLRACDAGLEKRTEGGKGERVKSHYGGNMVLATYKPFSLLMKLFLSVRL